MKQNTTFAYIKGNSIIHKCPAWIKILFIPLINIFFFNLPVQYCLLLILLQFVIAFSLKFTFRQQMEDIKPVLYYGALLIFMNFLIYIFTYGFNALIQNAMNSCNDPVKLLNLLRQNETAIMLVKLFCIMQSTSIFFKTSTSLQIRQGLEDIELFFRKLFRLSKKCRVSNAIAMFINFIPLVWQIWNELKRAWFARKGKNGVRMYLSLLPQLFSVGLKKAWNTARAVTIRNINY